MSDLGRGEQLESRAATATSSPAPVIRASRCAASANGGCGDRRPPIKNEVWRAKLPLLEFLDPIEHGITHPFVDGRLPPSGTAGGDAYLPGKGAILDFPVEGGAAEPGAVEHGVETKNAVGRLVGGHANVLSYDRSSCCDTPRIETEFLRVKAPKRALLSRSYAWISVENPSELSSAKNKFTLTFEWASQAVSA